jgi:hypothetical protein
MMIFYVMMHFDGGTTLKRRTYSLLCLRTKNTNLYMANTPNSFKLAS